MKRKLSGKFSQPQKTQQEDPKTSLPSQARTFPISNLPSGALLQNVTTSTANSVPVQPKLTIGQAGDKYEQEADTVAAQVVQQINAPVQRKPEEQAQASQAAPFEITAPAINTASVSQANPQTEALFNATVQRATDPRGGQTASADFETALHQTQGKGHSLDSNLQNKMGDAMGADFSSLNIHTDNQSDALCKSIQAKAFTTGNDIYFGKNEYQPNTSEGQFLIAHESAHSVQQNAVDVQRKETVVQRVGLTDASAALVDQQQNQQDSAHAADVATGRARNRGGAAFGQRPEPPAKWGVAADCAKQYNVTWEELRAQGTREFCIENIIFLDCCEYFYQNPTIEQMIYIYKNLIKAGSPDEINISGPTRAAISQTIETELQQPKAQRQIHHAIFDGAQQEISRLFREIGPHALAYREGEQMKEWENMVNILEDSGLM